MTYVGGGFGVGIHNLLEAAVWHVPVFFGPNNQRFQEAQDLKACGGGIEIDGADSFTDKMNRLIADHDFMQQTSKAAGEYVSTHAGALDKVMKEIKL